MKRALSLILALVLCLSLCACKGKEEAEPQPEIVSVDVLYEDLTNAAKCTLNVGKQVTVFGQIDNIASDSCEIRLIHPEETMRIRMPIEKLAALSVDQIIAVTGIVESYISTTSPSYTICATETLDDNAMDAVFREIMASKVNGSAFIRSDDFKESLYILYVYMYSRGDMYTMQDSAELRKYLCGTWDCGRYTRYYPDNVSASTFETLDITYCDDGSVKYSVDNSWSNDWAVNEDGSLQSFFGSQTVYILSDDVFVCDGHVFVRQ